MKKKIEEPKAIITGSYTSTTDGKNLTGSTTLNVEYDGEVYCKGIQVGSIVSSKNDYKLYLSGCVVSGSNNSYKYTDGTGAEKEGVVTATGSSKPESGDVTPSEPEVTKKENVEAAGITVYFDVYSGELCDKATYESSYDATINDYTNSLTGYNGITKTNESLPQNSCLKFYKYKEDDTTQTMILDHNTTATVAWYSSNDTSNGPSTGSDYVLGKLKSDTASWKGTIDPEDYTDSTGYTVDYNGYKARLITKAETNSIIADSMPGWLYDRTTSLCTTSGCLNNSDSSIYGYWTVSSYGVPSTIYVWTVIYNGRMEPNGVGYSGSYGVRPVITISK